MRRWILDKLGKALPVVNWTFLIVGLVGAAGTAIGLLPPLTESLWAKVTTILLWLLFAREGYEPLAEVMADEEA